MATTKLHPEYKELASKILQEAAVLKTKPDKVIHQGYLWQVDTQPEELRDSSKIPVPLWVVFGFWDNHPCIFVYDTIEVRRVCIISYTLTV